MIKPFFLRMRGQTRCPARKPLSKIAWSGVGAFLGIYLVASLSQLAEVGLLNSLFLVGSFGASAVLIYGAPQAEFSQPRNLLGGHILSALIGVTIARFVPLEPSLLAALAVALAIVAMHLTRTLHPPGGATALIAVIGGAKVQSLGYGFVVMPVATGALLLLAVALLINNLSRNPKRHYPMFWL